MLPLSHSSGAAEADRYAVFQCVQCATCMAGRRHVCIHCGSTDLKRQDPPTHGTLYAFTTVHVAPRARVPYSIGYVDCASNVRLLLQIENPEQCAPGVPVALVRRDDGTLVARAEGVHA